MIRKTKLARNHRKPEYELKNSLNIVATLEKEPQKKSFKDKIISNLEDITNKIKQKDNTHSNTKTIFWESELENEDKTNTNNEIHNTIEPADSTKYVLKTDSTKYANLQMQINMANAASYKPLKK